MLDQSFSPNNLRIILDLENRKGVYIENKSFFENDYFLKSRKVSEEIKSLNEKIKRELGKEPSDEDLLNKLENEKDILKKKRDDVLYEILNKINKNIDNDKFTLKLELGEIKFKSQLYKFSNTAENFFASKQIQRNILKTFKVKQQNRRAILSQLILHLEDKFPKVIIRTDIKSFYESIPHNDLLTKIDNNNLLSFQTKYHIKHTLNQYWKLVESQFPNKSLRKGIPRGIGFSAYLAELYLKKIDDLIKTSDNVIFYKRYVDDIIIIYSPSDKFENKSIDQYKKKVSKIFENTTKLRLHPNKTKCFDLKNKTKIGRTYKLDYLGYQFIFGWKKNKEDGVILKRKLEIKMSEKKLNRYSDKIKMAFLDYRQGLIKYNGKETQIRKLLISRIKYLSTNSRLNSRKQNVLIGIYFSNEFLTEPFSDLTYLDTLLRNEINKLPTLRDKDKKLVKKLKTFNFSKSFKQKKFSKFNNAQFENDKLLKIWKYL